MSNKERPESDPGKESTTVQDRPSPSDFGHIIRDFVRPALCALALLFGLLFALFFLTFIGTQIDFDLKDKFVRTIIALGPLGDYVGGLLNPLVALSALVGLIMSVRVQRETLKETQRGLREQLDQDNFFVLLANREAAIESLHLSRRSETKGVPVVNFHGRAAIREVLDYIGDCAAPIDRRPVADAANCLAQIFRSAVTPPELDVNSLRQLTSHFEIPMGLASNLETRVRVFAVLYGGAGSLSDSFGSKGSAQALLNAFKARYGIDSIEELLGHVFRSTYQVLKFAHRSSFGAEKQNDLVNYLRAQMSEAEFAAFALTALTSIGAKSRAASIAFNLYEKRLRSTPWARPLAKYFDRELLENRLLAKEEGFAPLELKKQRSAVK